MLALQEKNQRVASEKKEALTMTAEYLPIHVETSV
jgi:hypothetical protein